MSDRRSINTEGFAHVNPVPVASRIGGHLESGALTGRDLATRKFPESLDEQARIIFERIAELMAAAGGSPDDILKIQFFAADASNREPINKHWTAMFPDPASRPARHIVKADLDDGALLQAVVIAELPEDAHVGPFVSPAARSGTGASVAERAERDEAPEAGLGLTPELRALLAATPVSTLSSALRKRGYTDSFIEGVTTNQRGTRMVGTARTFRLIPYRPDLFQAYGGGFNAQKRAFDGVGEGEVLVIDARGVRETGTVGDILALRAQVRGAAGIVTDGGVRDYTAVQELGLPVFSQGPHPSVLGRRHVPWETDTTVACGGAAVVPGDVIVGDDDGVIVIPAAIVAEVAAEAAEQEREDAWVFEQVKGGAAVNGLFPPNAEQKARYLAETRGADGETPAP